jgi:hypothetical protein
MPSQTRDIEAIALLDEPVCRALFESRRAPVERSAATRRPPASVARALAAFHLDRLVGEGLLDRTCNQAANSRRAKAPDRAQDRRIRPD